MKCKKIKKIMAEALSGEINAEHQRMLDQHLSRCRNCSAEYTALRKTLDFTAKKTVPEPTEDEWQRFRRNLRRAIDAGRHPAAAAVQSKPYRWRKRLAPALAVALIVVVAALAAIKSLSPPQPQVSSEEIDYFVEKALIYDYLIQQLELEEVYLSEDDLYDLDQYLDELDWML